ncbi:MAG: GNAT family N-acetyltransferase [Solirubrobacteraceae bacterium]|nr:GNAT family N-acetyltransferase [Solirubrobacteraceae bacterium]
MTQPALTITRLPISGLDEIEPLWNALREHHGRIAPHFGPIRPREASWAIRKGLYEQWLQEDGAFALIARHGDQAVGYALTRIHGPVATWPDDSEGMLETLSVHPDARGTGVGSALIAATRAGVAEQGVATLAIGVIPTNDGAQRFYRRHGFTPYVDIIRGTTAPQD